jgi:hypothetical protein
MQLDCVARPPTRPFAPGRQSGIDGRTGIDHQDVAGSEEVREMAEASVPDPIVLDSGDHESYAVTRESACLGRLMCEQ